MEINVIGNAKRNIIVGTLNRIVALLCPFITRTILQIILGAEYLGLNSLFSSVLTVLSLSELGFSAAIVYCMYKPVAENDVKTVNALLNFYRKAYGIVGCVILLLGLVVVPFLGTFIKGSYPNDISLVNLYLVYLLNTVISYFMFAYKSSLIVVYQRDDINSITNMIVTLGLTGAQILALVLSHDYMVYSWLMPVFTVINNLRIAYVVKKMFPQYHCEGKLPKQLIKDIKKKLSGTVISRVCGVMRNSLDSICISAFIGLVATAKYNNYYYIISAVTSFLMIISNAFAGGIGNHVALRSPDENYEELKKLNFVYMWVSGWATVCILCLSQPFMKLWMGEDMILPDAMVGLLALYFYLLKPGDMITLYVQAAGLWWEHRGRSAIEAVANVVLNILLARIWGMYGIVLATILTIFGINYILGTRITFRCYFGKQKLMNYHVHNLKHFLAMLFAAILSLFLCRYIVFESNVVTMIARLILCSALVNLWFVLIYRKTSEFRALRGIVSWRKGERES